MKKKTTPKPKTKCAKCKSLRTALNRAKYDLSECRELNGYLVEQNKAVQGEVKRLERDLDTLKTMITLGRGFPGAKKWLQ